MTTTTMATVSMKFMFPLPTRRHRPAGSLSSPSSTSAGSLAKAQRLLGTSPEVWATQEVPFRFACGGSVSSVDEDGDDNRAPWSAIDGFSSMVPADDASSGRLQRSASVSASTTASSSSFSITHEKARLPLAAGSGHLPSKASALLDISGDVAAASSPSASAAWSMRRKASKQKRLFNLLPKPARHHYNQPGSDGAWSSPPSEAGDVVHPPFQPIVRQRTLRLSRKATKESLRSTGSEADISSPEQAEAARKAAAAKSTHDLHHLYQHYEHRTLLDVLAPTFQQAQCSRDDYGSEQEPTGLGLMPPPPPIPGYPSPPDSSSQATFQRYLHRGDGTRTSYSTVSAPDTPTTSTTTTIRAAPRGLPRTPPPNFSRPVSSPSRRTQRSGLDVDLESESVLLLSSDSEDGDYDDEDDDESARPLASKRERDKKKTARNMRFHRRRQMSAPSIGRRPRVYVDGYGIGCGYGSESDCRNDVDALESRVMAVTRQEELLLGALREKRARMRDQCQEEEEEEEEEEASQDFDHCNPESVLHHYTPPSPSLSESSEWSASHAAPVIRPRRRSNHAYPPVSFRTRGRRDVAHAMPMAPPPPPRTPSVASSSHDALRLVVDDSTSDEVMALDDVDATAAIVYYNSMPSDDAVVLVGRRDGDLLHPQPTRPRAIAAVFRPASRDLVERMPSPAVAKPSRDGQAMRPVLSVRVPGDDMPVRDDEHDEGDDHLCELASPLTPPSLKSAALLPTMVVDAGPMRMDAGQLRLSAVGRFFT